MLNPASPSEAKARGPQKPSISREKPDFGEN
jgi:hypothetical protein